MKTLAQIEAKARANLADFERMLEQSDEVLASLHQTRAACDAQIEQLTKHRHGLEESIERCLGLIRDAAELQR